MQATPERIHKWLFKDLCPVVSKYYLLPLKQNHHNHCTKCYTILKLQILYSYQNKQLQNKPRTRPKVNNKQHTEDKCRILPLQLVSNTSISPTMFPGNIQLKFSEESM